MSAADPFTDAARLLFEQLGARARSPYEQVRLSLPTSRATPQIIAQIRDVLLAHPGPRPVILRLVQGERATVLELPMAVASSVAAPLGALLGPEGVTA